MIGGGWSGQSALNSASHLHWFVPYTRFGELHKSNDSCDRRRRIYWLELCPELDEVCWHTSCES